MCRRPRFLALLSAASCFSIAAGKICAADYYVSTTGSDSNAGTLTQPWRTLQYAANTAGAGDTVYIRGGSYAERFSLTGKAGTAALPVTIRNYESESAVIDLTGVAPASGTAAIIRLHNCSHVIIRGLEIRNYKTSSSNSVPIGILVSGSGTGIQLLNNRIHGIWQSYPVLNSFDANAHGILVSGSSSTPITEIAIEGNEVYDLRLGASEAMVLNGNVTNFIVRKNIVHDCNNIGIDFIGFEGTASSSSVDYARNGLCAENTVYNIDTQYNPAYGGNFTTGGGNDTRGAAGIYVDGGANIIIERNHVHDCNFGIEVGCEHGGKNATGIIVRNNLLRRNHVGGIFVGGYSRNVGGTTNSSFTHNTLVVNDTAGYGGGQINLQHNIRTTTIRHNIIVANTATRQFVLNANTTTSLAANSINWNLYVGASASSVEFIWRNADYSSFTAWKTASGQDAHSVFASSAAFVDAANGDFTLQSSSPARDAGDPSFSPAAGEVDYDGRARVFDSRTDMGMAEYGSPLANAPLAVTGAAAVADYNTATVNGTVNPVSMDAEIWFEYGTTTAFGSRTPSQFITAGTSVVDVSALLDGLTHKKTWYYRLVSSNITGKNAGRTLSFQTPAMPPPVISAQPVSQLVALNQSVQVTAAVSGGEPMTLRWRRNGLPLPAATGSAAMYSINSMTVQDAGTYTLKATNGSGETVSQSAVLGVVDGSELNVTGNEDAILALDIGAAPANLMICQWMKDRKILMDDGRVTGAFSPRLTIRDCGPADAGDYVCRIAMGGLTKSSGVRHVSIRLKPVVQPLVLARPWVVSGSVTDVLTAKNSPDRFRVSGLPAGMKFDPASGALSGQPLYPGDYTLRISAGNEAGYGPEQIINISVQPLPEQITGTFEGTLPRSSSFQQNSLGSSASWTISKTGHLTGTMRHGKWTIPFTTRVDGQWAAPFKAEKLIRIPSSPALTLLFKMAIDSQTGAVSGELSNPAAGDQLPLILNGIRNAWSSHRPATGFAAQYTLVGQPASALDNDPAYPKGWSFAFLTVNKTGTTVLSARLADDTQVTHSGILSNSGEVLVHRLSNASTSSVLGTLSINPPGITGLISWLRHADSTRTTRVYTAGVPLHDLTVTGNVWETPSDSTAKMNLRSTENNTQITMEHGGLDRSAQATNNTLVVTLQSNYTARVSNSTSNPLKLSLKINSTNGLFSGQFTLRDPNPVQGKSDILRPVTFRGAIVQDQSLAGGYFLLPSLPVPTAHPPVTLLNSPKLSGRVIITPAAP